MANFLFFRKKSGKHPYLLSFLRNSLGIVPGDIDLYAQAFRHKSVVQDSTIESNERLEFLGDSVISTIVSELLYEKYQGESEGFLTQLRSKIVNRSHLNKLGEQLNLIEHIEYQKGPGEHKSLLGNVFEALFGAIYLDKGYKTTKKIFLEQIFDKYIDVKKLQNTIVDFKSQLLIYCQKNKLELNYKTLGEEIIDSRTHFLIGVYIEDKLVAEAKATSKRKAEQKASEIAFSNL